MQLPIGLESQFEGVIDLVAMKALSFEGPNGEHVVAHFGPGMACLDYKGTVLWRASEPRFHEFSRYGAAASPVRPALV